jgi:hypothetical protein
MDAQSNPANRDWKVLCHNIIGINSEGKWNSIRNMLGFVAED